jgi:hypothetical protein
VCSISDAKRDECIQEAIQTFLPKLEHPIPSLNLPALDPYTHENITQFEYQVTPQIRGRVKAKDIKVSGFTKGQFKDIKSKFDGDKIEMLGFASFPKLRVEGIYKGEAFVNTMKYNSRGNFNMTLSEFFFFLKFE